MKGVRPMAEIAPMEDPQHAFRVTTDHFTAHAIWRFNERARAVGFDDEGRREMLKCLSAANPNDIELHGASVRVPTGCCVFVFKADDGKQDDGVVVTVLPVNFAEGLPTADAPTKVSRP